MSSTTSYRLSGVALILGSVLSIIYYVSEVFINGPFPEALAGPVAVIGSLIGFINGMRALLSTDPDMEVVGIATNGDEVISLAASLQPEVILMDLQMPGIGGIEATRRILHTSPHIRILVVTMFEDDHSVFAALRAGARGYILKDTDEDEILRAIRAVGRGEAIFSPTIAQHLIDFFAAPRPAILPHLFPELTDREREILLLIAQGYNNSAIARHLTLSLKTVANHVSNIFSKLQVADRAQAIIRAREAGFDQS